jgi:hypothetical protein
MQGNSIRFNPPPGWPPPPPGWIPPPGWEPDPSWPPVPTGWPLWIYDYSRRRSGRPWYGRTWLIVVALIFLFPLGVALLWMRTEWSICRRSLVTAAVGALFITVLASSPPPTQQSLSASQGQPTSNTASPVPPARTVSPSKARASKTLASKTPASPASPQKAKPTPRPSTKRPPSAPTCGGPKNPYQLNLCGRGHLVTSPPVDVCSYFSCIPSFDNGIGYMAECNDGMYSMSGGRPGTCSHHHGEGRPVRQG